LYEQSGLTLGVRGGQEEHRPALDERAIGVGEDVVCDDLLQPVGQPSRLEAILEASRPVVVQLALAHVVSSR
jgi:hypothetical protein